MYSRVYVNFPGGIFPTSMFCEIAHRSRDNTKKTLKLDLKSKHTSHMVDKIAKEM